MGARFHKLIHDLRSTFWVVPAILVTAGVFAAFWAVGTEGADWIPDPVMSILYEGGESGARTLLGAIATSTIGVTGTLFSITIAALTLASSQMGPRLLDNFTRDRGNQVVLGVFLGTFAYCLVVLRQVRGGEDDLFVPRLALAGAMLLAMSRAIGETMIVTMAAGLAAKLTFNPLDTVTTVTVQIVTLLTGDQAFNTPKTLSAFGLGLTLFLVTLVLNIIAQRIVQTYRQQYD